MFLSSYYFLVFDLFLAYNLLRVGETMPSLEQKKDLRLKEKRNGKTWKSSYLNEHDIFVSYLFIQPTRVF